MQRTAERTGPLPTAEEVRVHVLHGQLMHLTFWHYNDRSVPYWRLYWNKTRGASLLLNGQAIPLLPSQMYLVTPNTTTSNRLARPLAHYFIHFVADPPFDRVSPGIIPFPATPELIDAFQQLAGFPDAEPPRKQRLSTRALFLCYYALSKVPPEIMGTGYRDRRVMAAIACMDNSRKRPATNATLARAVGMHPTAFSRLFKHNTGYSPQAFFRIRRIEEACRLLHFSLDSIKAIASAMGFYDRYHFSRVFKEIRGSTPAKFRRLR